MAFFRDYELRVQNPPYETSVGTTRYQSSVLSFGGALWVMGGIRAPGSPSELNDVWKSTDSGATWAQQTSAAWASGARYMGACVHDGKMFVSGGSAPNASNGVFSSTDGITWTTVRADGAANGFTARNRHALASYDGNLWVVGGAATVWKSTDGGAVWTQTTATPGWDSSRIYPQCTVHDGKLWMACGQETGGDKKDIWYTTDGITWTQATSNIHADFTPRYNVTFFSRGGRLYVGHGTGPKDLWTSADGVTWTREHAQATMFDTVGGGPTGFLHSDGSVYIFMAASYVDDSTNRSVWRSILAGELAETNANDTIAATGEAINPAGTLAKTNANDTLAAAGQTSTSGSLAETNADDTLYGVLYGTLSPPTPPPGDTVVGVGTVDSRINTGSKVPYFYLGEDELLDVKYYRPIYYWESMDPDKFDNLGEDDLDQLDDEVFQMKYENMTKSEFVAWKKRTRGF